MKKEISTLFLVCSLLLASCGGGGASSTINVTLVDFQFVPNSFNIPAGQEITVNIANNGSVIHNFVIMKLGTTAGQEWDDSDVSNVYWEVEIQPGGDSTVTFTAPTEPGKYEVVCRTEGHIMAGMVGSINVVAGE